MQASRSSTKGRRDRMVVGFTTMSDEEKFMFLLTSHDLDM